MKRTLLAVVFATLTLLGFSQTYNFTTGGKTGELGPSQSDLNAAYTGTNLAGAVTSNNGIQLWTVPSSGNYRITAIGAQGYGPFGGRGASMQGEFYLSAGQQLKILVGQQGGCCVGSGTNQYGGGGGSFVTDNANTPLVVAGGGGGSWANTFTTTTDASTSTSGNTAANGPSNGAGGTNGGGGSSIASAGGGGGLTGDATLPGNPGGFSFLNGGNGGTSTGSGGRGGFGGGGGANSWNNRRGGGGGGYSGGGGAGSTTSGLPEGGGGGSFNAGLNQVNLAGVGLGDGSVIVEQLSPPAPYNAGVSNLTDYNGMPYYMYPFTQGVNQFQALVRNFGFDTISGTTVNISVLNTTFTGSVFVDTLEPSEDTTVLFFNPFFPTSADTFTARAIVSINELDSLNDNDTAFYEFAYSDTVIARDNGVVTSGIGNATPVAFGHRFTLNFPDTITSISFYLDNPTQGTKIRCLLYAFDPVSNEPDVLIDSSRVIQIGANGAGWYTTRMGCGEVVLPNGDYFIAAEQINPVNMSFGYTSYYPAGAGTINYVDLKDGQGWLPSTSPSLNQLLNSITFMLRVNLGHARDINVLGGDTTFFCNGARANLKTGLPYEIYSWNNGSFLDSLVTNVDGFYSVTVTDDANCVFNGSTWVKELNPITTFPTTTPTSTCGGSDGSATMVAVGDKPPFSFAWSNGQSGFTATGLPGGTHFVTITDAIGCDYINSVDVLGAFPVVNVSSTSPICNGFFNGTATASVVQGVAPITYNWSTGGSANSISGIAAGTYKVSVTDASGCTSIQSIAVTNPPIINVDFSNSTNPTLCRANNGVAVANVSGGIAPYSFAWGNGQNTNSIISLKAGTYAVTITDSVGCQKVGSVTLNDPNPPSLSTTGSSVVCGDDSTGTASVNVTGGTPPYNVLWSTNSTSNSISNLPSGSYGVQVIDGAGCVAFDNAIVSGPDPILAILQANYDLNNICNNDIFISQLSGGTAPYTYQWDDPNNQTTASATGLCNGAYNVVITDANSCTKDFSIIIFNPKTGVGEIAENSSLEIYPNPSNGLVNFNLTRKLTNAEINIFSINGELVKSINPNSQLMMNVDLSNLAEGSYIIKLTSDEENVIQQIQIIK